MSESRNERGGGNTAHTLQAVLCGGSANSTITNLTWVYEVIYYDFYIAMDMIHSPGLRVMWNERSN